MNPRSTESPAGQLANVSAALIAASPTSTSDATEEQARLLARLFEDLVLVGADVSDLGRKVVPTTGERGFGAAFIAALEAAREDRVLVLDAGGPPVSAKLVLGMTAWPEHECVAPGDTGVVNPRCFIVKREAALAKAHAKDFLGSTGFDEVVAGFDCSFIDESDLAQLMR